MVGASQLARTAVERRMADGLRRLRKLICVDAASDYAPFGAPPPFFVGGGTWKGFLAVAWQSSDAKTHREDDGVYPPLPLSRGGMTKQTAL